MTTLLRIRADHDQLEGCYRSEPILAEASAQVTAKYGRAKHLEALVTELRYRGYEEFSAVGGGLSQRC